MSPRSGSGRGAPASEAAGPRGTGLLVASYGWCLPADTLSQDAGSPRGTRQPAVRSKAISKVRRAQGWGWEVVSEVGTQPSLMAET